MSARRALTDAQVDEACALREQGLTLPEIKRHFAAKGVNVSRGSLGWTCLVNGADLPVDRRQPRYIPNERTSVKRGAHVVRYFTEDEDRQLLALEAEGKSRAAIGRALGRPHNSIIGRLATLARREARAEEMPWHAGLKSRTEREGVEA